jgi:hypothetical protein
MVSHESKLASVRLCAIYGWPSQSFKLCASCAWHSLPGMNKAFAVLPRGGIWQPITQRSHFRRFHCDKVKPLLIGDHHRPCGGRVPCDRIFVAVQALAGRYSFVVELNFRGGLSRILAGAVKFGGEPPQNS